MKEKIKNWLRNNWFKIIAIGFLLGALAGNPYGYYQFLRWLILASGAYAAYLVYLVGKKVWTGIFVVIAILFNPIVPFYFSRDFWQVVDVAVAIIFFISLFSKSGKSGYERKN